MKTFVITAAGGNPTAIKEIQIDLNREEYERFGNKLMDETKNYGVEQAGFLIHKDKSISHFEMSGGEFCGNAARSASVVLSLLENKEDVSFSMSGFANIVSSTVKKKSNNKFYVTCKFPNFDIKITDVDVNCVSGKLVDLGGIVHFVIEGVLPLEYEKLHKKITKDLGLDNRDAVGVVWFQKKDNYLEINPVVWVRSINTFFKETSCGSGTIAVSAVTGASEIRQPSGGVIKAQITKSEVLLESEMEIIFQEENEVSYITISKDNENKYKDEFIYLYKDVFCGPPYFEEYEDLWILENVWDPSIKDGCIILAISNNNVIGLSCAIPVRLEKKVFDFLSNVSDLPVNLNSAIYMSELGVSKLHRKSKFHVGSQLVKRRISWAKKNGFHYYIMRTAANGSNSENLYTNIIGAKKMGGVIQKVSDNIDEISSSSDQRVFLYGSIT